MKIKKIFKKIVSFVILSAFLASSNVYSYSIDTKLRPPLQAASNGNINRFKEALKLGNEVLVSDIGQAVFINTQIEEIYQEIEKYCGKSIRDAKKSFEELERSEVMAFQSIQSRENIVTALKGIPQFAGSYTNYAYDSLLALLKSNLVTDSNQQKILQDFSDILKEISKYSAGSIHNTYSRLKDFMGSKLITKNNIKEVVSILKSITFYLHLENHAINGYNGLEALLKSGLCEKAGYEKVSKRFLDILKEISTKMGIGVDGDFIFGYFVTSIDTGMITESNWEEIFDIFEEILKYKEILETEDHYYFPNACSYLLEYLESGFIEKINSKEVLFIFKEIPRHMGANTRVVYNNLLELFRRELITKYNYKELLAIFREVYLRFKANNAYFNSYQELISLLDFLQDKGIIMDSNSSAVILDMLTKENDAEVFKAIKEFVLIESEGAVMERKPGTPNNLSMFLNPIHAQQETLFSPVRAAPIWMKQDSAPVLSYASEIFTEKQKKIILKKAKKYCGEYSESVSIYLDNILFLLEKMEQTGYMNSKNRKDVFILLKGIPRFATSYTQEAYKSLEVLLKFVLSARTGQKEILIGLSKIPAYAGRDSYKVYDCMAELFRLGAIVETNCVGALKDFSDIMKIVAGYTKNYRTDAYNTIMLLFKSGAVSKINHEKILKNLSDIFKDMPRKNPKYSGYTLWEIYQSLKALLESGFVTEVNYEKIFKDFSDIIGNTLKYPKNYSGVTWKNMEALMKLFKIMGDDKEEAFTIFKEISQYAEDDAGMAYGIFNSLFDSALITQDNRKEIFAILKGIIPCARKYTGDAYLQLKKILILMQEKNLILDRFSSAVILKMIEEGGSGKHVIETLNLIRDFISENSRDFAAEADSKGLRNLSSLLNFISARQEELPVIVQDQAVFTEEQKKDISEEIEKYCGKSIREAKKSFEELERSKVMAFQSIQSRENIVTALKGIPQFAGSYTNYAYDSLLALLKSNLVTDANQQKILQDFSDILKEIFQGKEIYTRMSCINLSILLGSGLIKETNQEAVFAILKAIPQFAESDTYAAYDSLLALLKSNLVTDFNQQKILQDFLNISKEISKYSGVDAYNSYSNFSLLLSSGFIKETNQEDVFAVLEEIPEFAGNYTTHAYKSLKVLLESRLIMENNWQEAVVVLKEIPLYATGGTNAVYDSLLALLEFCLIAEIEQRTVLSILKEIPKRARLNTINACNSLRGLLVVLREKSLALDENSLPHILYMIKTGDMDTGVKITLDLIKECVLKNVREPVLKTGPQSHVNLSILFNSILTKQYPLFEVRSDL